MSIARNFGVISGICAAFSVVACGGRAPSARAPQPAAQAAQDALSPKAIAASTRRSIVTVHAGPQLGSGFFVAPGVVATNFHVIEGQELVAVKTVDGAMYAVRVVRGFDASMDLALLEIDGTADNAPLALADSDRVSQGDVVFALGSPRGLESTLSTGIVSAIRKTDDSHFFQVTAPIAPGSSGGPALNDQGQVIGVVTAMSTEAQNVGFAVPASYVKKLLADRGTPIAPAELAARVRAAQAEQASSETQGAMIAGFHLGMTLADANERCNGQLTGTPNEATCPFAPVRVLFASGDVHLELDMGRVSSIRIHAASWPAARDALVDRYGAPTGYAVSRNGRWENARSFDASKNSVALWDFRDAEILAMSTPKGVDVKYVLKAANELRAAAY